MDHNEEFEKNLTALRLWVKVHHFLPHNIPDDYLTIFLFSCYSKLEATKKTMECYFKLKSSTPEFFNNRDLDLPDLKTTTDTMQICILPQKTKQDYAIVWSRLIDYNPEKFLFDEGIKLLFMVVDTLLRNEGTNARGLIFVFDNEGTTLGHLKKANLSSLKKYFSYLQEAMPIRLKGIHVVNSSPVMTHIMALIRPFIGKEQAKMISLHTTDQIANLYDTIPKEYHPQNYGGEGQSMDALFSNTCKSIRANKDWFSSDSTLRVTKCDIDPLEGSFRKLDID